MVNMEITTKFGRTGGGDRGLGNGRRGRGDGMRSGRGGGHQTWGVLPPLILGVEETELWGTEIVEAEIEGDKKTSKGSKNDHCHSYYKKVRIFESPIDHIDPPIPIFIPRLDRVDSGHWGRGNIK